MFSSRALVALALLSGPALSQSLVDFDDAAGQLSPLFEGSAVRLPALIDMQYLSLGVIFDSAGGGLARTESSNPVSPPNVVTATAPGPVATYLLPASASFWRDEQPGVVDFVSLTLTNSSSFSTLEAYDVQGPMAFDDFAFGGLAPLGIFAVTPPNPGRAGTTNEFVVTGAAPFEPVLLWVDVPGSAWAQPLVVPLVADAMGKVRHVLAVPATLAGLALHTRVVGTVSGESPWVIDVLAPMRAPVSPALSLPNASDTTPPS